MRVCREDDDPGRAVPSHDLPGGLDPVGPRHLDVHHEDIGLELLYELDGAGTIGTAADHGQARLVAQQLDQGLPDVGVVVNHEDPLHDLLQTDTPPYGSTCSLLA